MMLAYSPSRRASGGGSLLPQPLRAGCPLRDPASDPARLASALEDIAANASGSELRLQIAAPRAGPCRTRLLESTTLPSIRTAQKPPRPLIAMPSPGGHLSSELSWVSLRFRNSGRKLCFNKLKLLNFIKYQSASRPRSSTSVLVRPGTCLRRRALEYLIKAVRLH